MINMRNNTKISNFILVHWYNYTMKHIVAVSGGVDSMVLLYLMRQKYAANDLVVAHFNHHTRPSSNDDEKFVQAFCDQNHLEYKIGHAKPHQHLSEEKARTLRYDFLNNITTKPHQIYTAHHLDDLIESIAINFTRGTGWRGLATMNNSKISRPFLDGTFEHQIYDRRDILRHAAKHQIPYRQDPTNTEDAYLRNRLREATFNLNRQTKESLLKLRNQQCEISTELNNLLKNLLPTTTAIPRQLFQNLDDQIAIELLRQLTLDHNISLTRPQLQDFLTAIRTYQPGKKFNLPGDQLVRIDKNYFVL